MNSWQDLFRPTEVGRLGALVGLMGAVAGGLLWLFVQLNQAPMGLLYADLAAEDAARIIERLDQGNIPYDVRGNGSVIYVPKDQVFSLRMEYAAEGIPANGIVGYELFDEGDAFGTTSFVQNINRLRALEGELSRTIAALDAVEAARVHLVLPERELFSREEVEPSASIVIRPRRGQLNTDQVQAIQYLVASAVQRLSPGRVSIVDERGMLLASGDGEESATLGGASADARQAAYERRLRDEVEELVSSIVGPGNVRVEVAAEMDFNRIVTESETYDPERQVVESSQLVEEIASSSEGGQSGAVSVSTELPEGEAAEGAPGAATPASTSNRTEERINYLNSLTRQTQVLEAGRVQRLSVAVVVNDAETVAEDGTVSFAARSEAEMAQIAAVVRSAIGYNEARSDQVEVVNIRFTRLPKAELEVPAEPLLGLQTSDYLRYAEKVVFALIAIALIFFVFRPLIGRLLTPTPASASAEAGAPALAAAGTPQITGPGHVTAEGQVQAPAIAQGGTPDALPAPSAGPRSNIDIAQVEGQVKESSVRKVGEIVHQHPEESMSILRNWLYETT